MQKVASTKTTEKRDLLFGTTQEEESLLVHQAKAKDKMTRGLSSDERLFGGVSRTKAAEKLAKRGASTIDVEETGKVSQEGQDHSRRDRRVRPQAQQPDRSVQPCGGTARGRTPRSGGLR